MRATILATLLLAASLTGCIGSSDDAVTPTEEPDPDPVENETEPNASTDPTIAVTWFNGTIQGAGSPGIAHACQPSTCENAIAFPVEANATAIVIEAAWDASTAMQLSPDAPDETTCEPVTPAGLLARCNDPEAVHGQSPLRAEVTGEAWLGLSGEWTARLWADGAAQPVEVTMVATVVYDGTSAGEVVHLGA